jgi:hypothetical protein
VRGDKKGREGEREPSIPMADLPAASLPGARSAGKDPTVVMMCSLVYCEARFGNKSGSEGSNREKRVGETSLGRGDCQVEECEEEREEVTTFPEGW